MPTFRPPTITEAFMSGAISPSDSVGDAVAPNANLQPETARTSEIGANIIRNGIFADSDRFRLKAVAFHREIRDFIVLGYLQTPQVAGWEYLGFVNAGRPHHHARCGAGRQLRRGTFLARRRCHVARDNLAGKRQMSSTTAAAT